MKSKLKQEFTVNPTTGTKWWYLSDSGIFKFGSKKFYDVPLHRDGGPAVEWYDGRKEWWVNGKRHRVNGPAKIWADGSVEYWLNGKEHTKNEWLKAKLKIIQKKLR